MLECDPEGIMTILIAFHQSAYHRFKAFYLDKVCLEWRCAFAGLVSYHRKVFADKGYVSQKLAEGLFQDGWHPVNHQAATQQEKPSHAVAGQVITAQTFHHRVSH